MHATGHADAARHAHTAGDYDTTGDHDAAWHADTWALTIVAARVSAGASAVTGVAGARQGVQRPAWPLQPPLPNTLALDTVAPRAILIHEGCSTARPCI